MSKKPDLEADALHPKGSRLWHTLDDEADRCEAVVRTANRLETLHAGRRAKILANIEVYEACRLGSLSPGAYMNSSIFAEDDYDMVRLNEARSVVNTAIAKIAAKQRPRAQFCCSEADWSVRRRAKKLEKYVEAVMLQRQQGMVDAFDVGMLMFRDLCVADSGWIKIYADHVKKKVQIKRIPPWEILWDPQEARNGEPQNLFHVMGYDRYLLAELFPDHREAIMAAKGLDEDNEFAGSTDLYGYGEDTSRMIKVRECWRLPAGPNAPGRHSIVICGEQYVDLAGGEEWDLEHFPLESMVWESHMMGIVGTSLVENISGLCSQLNASIQRRAEAETLGSNMIIECEEDSIADEDLESNSPCIIVKRRKGSPPLNITAPQVVSQGSVQWAQQLQSWVHDASGFNSQDTAAVKTPGIESGQAIREIKELGTERFAVQWQKYEKLMAVGIPRHIIACTRELAKALGDDVIVRWPGGDYYEDLKWSKVSLEDDQYHVQVYAVSGLVNTPADRLALATELVDRGFMSREVYLRVIQAKDIDAELGKSNSASQWVEKCIEQWMDATKKDLKNGDFRFRGPPPRWLGPQVLTDTVLQVGLAYLDADLANCPQWNLQWFERFMVETDLIVQQLLDVVSNREAAAKGNTAGVQGLGGAPGGMPPLPPGHQLHGPPVGGPPPGAPPGPPPGPPPG